MHLSPDALIQALFRHPPARRYVIAYSGGLDSRVLLQLCAESRTSPEAPVFTAIHVHHGLHPDADDWAEHCENVCGDLAVPFRWLRVDAKPQPGLSPEEVARNARYAALAMALDAGDTLLTAQHQDDQAETFLLQLMRGAGLAGLSAMPERAPLGRGFLLRPLLQCSHQDIQAFAEQRGIRWRDDPSNRDLNFDRNYLRHQVVPLLRARWPAFGAAVGRAAKHCATADEAARERGRSLYETVKSEGSTLSIAKLESLAANDRALVIREWMRAHGQRMPSARVTQQALDLAFRVRLDGNAVVRWRNGEIRRYRQRLFLLAPQVDDLSPEVELQWLGDQRLQLGSNNGWLEADPRDGSGIARDPWLSATRTVGYRRGGERFRLAGRQGTHDLKKLFQEAGIPPWIRRRTPLIYLDGRLAAAGDRWVAAEFAASTGEQGYRILWNH